MPFLWHLRCMMEVRGVRAFQHIPNTIEQRFGRLCIGSAYITKHNSTLVHNTFYHHYFFVVWSVCVYNNSNSLVSVLNANLATQCVSINYQHYIEKHKLFMAF
jgi:hypothetical protein